jgi:hypothetical protein
MTRNVRPALLTLASLFCVALIGIGAWNYLTVLRPVSVANGDHRIQASVHYQHYLNPSVLCFNLKQTQGSSMMDVFFVLLQSAKSLSSLKFDKVELQYRGDLRFILEGEFHSAWKRESRPRVYFTRIPNRWNQSFSRSDSHIYL